MEQETLSPAKASGQNRILIKGAIIGVLILLMLIPAGYVQQLVLERESRLQEVQQEISGKWASSQTVSGPVLVVPYRETVNNSKGKPEVRELFAYFLPEKLNVKGNIDPEIRKRNLYEVVLYKSALEMEGNFLPVNGTSLSVNRDQWIPEKAHLIMGLTDARGMEENVVVNWNGTPVMFSPGPENDPIVGRGLIANVPLDIQNPLNNRFSLKIRLKGSGSFFLSPSAGSTSALLRSPWKNPAFDGDFLGEHEISDSGFTAQWKLLGQNANLPLSWKGGEHSLKESRFGVNLIQPADGYAKTMRSTKYAILFIGLTFSLFFFIEILQKKNVHSVQYVLIGLALSIFYSLLLSISEYLDFDGAYLIAAAATVLLITFYSRSVFGKWKLAVLPGAALSLLYFFIYVLLQAEDNALLFGSIGLFITLAVIMYFSRKINWYGTPVTAGSVQ